MTPPKPRERRDSLEITREIVYATREPLKKTQVMYRCNLSFDQLKFYLELLTDLNILELTTNEKGKTTYQRTEKGGLLLDVATIHMDLLANRGSEDSYLDENLVREYRAALTPIIRDINERNNKKNKSSMQVKVPSAT